MTPYYADESVTLYLNGHAVPVEIEPDLPWPGNTRWSLNFTGCRVPPATIQLREPDPLAGRVLLHEVLHALVGTDPQAVCTPDDPRHEDFVRMLTAGLFDGAGYRKIETPDGLAKCPRCYPKAKEAS